MSDTDPNLVIDTKITTLEVPMRPQFHSVQERDKWDFLDRNSMSFQIVQPVIESILK